MAERKQHVCVACMEPLQPGAKVCPHCHSRQHRSPTQTFTDGLKWAAGIAALITLILSASELNQLVEVWLKNEHAVAEYIDAARLLAESGDHSNAQSLLQRATELDPASAELRDLRIELAQKKLRTFLLLDRNGQYPTELVKEKNSSGQEVLDFRYRDNAAQELENLQLDSLAPLFARGVVTATQQRKATLLAHLAWIDLLRRYGPVEFRVNERFQQALAIDQANPYANAMAGAWLLSPRNNNELPPKERIDIARQLFTTALQTENKEMRSWVETLWLQALVLADGVAAEHELLRVLQQFKDAGRAFSENGPAAAALNLNFIHSVARGHPSNEKNEQRIQQLLAAFTPTDLQQKLNWLSKLRYGCTPSAGCEVGSSAMANMLYLSGRFHAAAGEPQQALEAFRLGATPGYSHGLSKQVMLQQLEATLAQLGIPSQQVLAYRYSSDPPLQKGDLLIEYQGQSYPHPEDLQKLNERLGNPPSANVKVLRKGQIIALTTKLLAGHQLETFVVPNELLQPGNGQQLAKWFAYE